ncbi:hypothetical protein [Methylocapsa sp. S129]|nr:hypothetical protein [Methylocapsa sp. S129]
MNQFSSAGSRAAEIDLAKATFVGVVDALLSLSGLGGAEATA